MKYLLDTSVISELVKSRPNMGVLGWLKKCDEDTLFISVLTIGEIQKGIARLDASSRKAALQQWLDGDMRVRFDKRILAVTDEVCLTWGIIQGDAEQKGATIPSIDGLIAATALNHNLTIVTRNEKDFAATSVQVLNPWLV